MRKIDHRFGCSSAAILQIRFIGLSESVTDSVYPNCSTRWRQKWEAAAKCILLQNCQGWFLNCSDLDSHSHSLATNASVFSFLVASCFVLSHCRWTWFDRPTGLFKSLFADLLTEANVAHSSVAQDSLFIYLTDSKASNFMPLGKKTKRILKRLADIADERACAVCYWTFIQHYISAEDNKALLATAKDCLCDWPEKCGKRPKESDNQGSGSTTTQDAAAVDDVMKALRTLSLSDWDLTQPSLAVQASRKCAVAAALTSRWSEESRDYEIRARCVQCVQQGFAGFASCWAVFQLTCGYTVEQICFLSRVSCHLKNKHVLVMVYMVRVSMAPACLAWRRIWKLKWLYSAVFIVHCDVPASWGLRRHTELRAECAVKHPEHVAALQPAFLSTFDVTNHVQVISETFGDRSVCGEW